MDFSVSKEEIEVIRVSGSVPAPGELEWRNSCVREFRSGGGGMELDRLMDTASVYQMVRNYLNIVDAKGLVFEPETETFREDIFDCWLNALAVPCSSDDLLRELVTIYVSNEGVSSGIRSMAGQSILHVGKSVFPCLNDDARAAAVLQKARSLDARLPECPDGGGLPDLHALEICCDWFFDVCDERPRGVLMAHNLYLFCEHV